MSVTNCYNDDNLDWKDMYCRVCNEKREVNPEILKQVIIIAVEIAREGIINNVYGEMV